MSDLAAVRSNLELLREQFADAAKKYPCLEHVLVQWPEDSPDFDRSMIPQRYALQMAPGKRKGDICLYNAVFATGADVSGSRHKRGRATMQWLRRDFGNLRYDFRDSESAMSNLQLPNPEEEKECVQRFKVLSHSAARLVAKSGLWKDADTDWRGVYADRCVMFVHETNGGTTGRNRFFLPAPYEGAFIDDVFLASAETVNEMLAALAGQAANNQQSPAVGKDKGEGNHAKKLASKQKSKRQQIRAQRLNFSKPRRRKGTPWSEIYNDYNKKYPADEKANAATPPSHIRTEPRRK